MDIPDIVTDRHRCHTTMSCVALAKQQMLVGSKSVCPQIRPENASMSQSQTGAHCTHSQQLCIDAHHVIMTGSLGHDAVSLDVRLLSITTSAPHLHHAQAEFSTSRSSGTLVHCRMRVAKMRADVLCDSFPRCRDQELIATAPALEYLRRRLRQVRQQCA